MTPGDPAHALDFWVGTWDATWDGGHGTNVVSLEHDGHVVVERFEAAGPEAFTGTSLSVYDRADGCWRQMWADSDGNHWWFTGGPTEEGFELSVAEREDGVPVRKRMVFCDIGPDAFRWRWERSRDDGGTWELRWEIAYRRRPHG